MTKQEEIREGIREGIAKILSEDLVITIGESVDEGEYVSALQMARLKEADVVLAYLHSQGVVIKVERELPERTWYNDWGGESGKAGYKLCQDDMAGYEATIPLIEKQEGIADE